MKDGGHEHPRARGPAAVGLLAALLAACGAAPLTMPAAPAQAGPRAAVAVPSGEGRLFTWRALAGDGPGTRFTLHCDGRALTPAPQALTQFLDTAPRGDGPPPRCTLHTEGGSSEAVRLFGQPFWRIAIEPPAAGADFHYEANDGAPADLDGDGQMEIVLKWQPTNARDNSQPGPTAPTFLDAWRLDGTRLWRIDLGPHIRSGAHYTPFVVDDFDGDGRAELMARTADGTVDGTGRVLGDGAARHANERGYVLAGPEFITVFDGRSGAALASLPYVPERGDPMRWGDAYGNRVDRFLAGVAHLDGRQPSAVFSRGYYTRAVLAAWDWRGGRLSQRWVFDSDSSEANRAARGQGAHWFAVADVDGDGRDDIVYGAATLGSDGRLLHSTGLGHGDALHVGRLDPARDGLQAFMVHESPRVYGAHGVAMHDAATGRLLWSFSGEGQDVGRGACMDIDPAHPGDECWASVGPLVNARGEVISQQRPRAVNFGLWWDGDLLRETLDGTTVAKWQPDSATLRPLLQGRDFGASSNNGTKATPVFSADILGDWREEVVWRSADHRSLMIFSTPHPTPHRLRWLMLDRQYRNQVAAQNAGYNQPPHPSFHLGAAMKTETE